MSNKPKRKGGIAKVCVTGVIVAGLSVACIPSAIAYSSEKAAEAVLSAEEQATPAEFEKTEVVYATLSASGSVENVYVVNQFDVTKAGEVSDFGAYTDIANLTDQGKLDYEEGLVTFDADEGAFYYQGNSDTAVLPWNVNIDYSINGTATSPDQLAGASGDLAIHVTTTPAEGVNPAFSECYMLQITFTLNGDTTTDIVADGATVAQSGRNRTVAFTVLPGQNADFVLTAKVSAFEMTGTQIAALPYSMVMEMPETDEMTEGIGQLSDAVSQLNDGTEALADGVGELSDGAAELSAGSAEFGDGLSQLNDNAAALVAASAQFNDALQQIVSGLEGFDVSSLENMKDTTQMVAYLRSVAGDLETVAREMNAAHTAYAGAYEQLSIAMGDLSSAYGNISESDLAAVKEAARIASTPVATGTSGSADGSDASGAEGDAAGAGATQSVAPVPSANESAAKLFEVYNAAGSVLSAYGDGSAFSAANSALARFQTDGDMYQTLTSAAGLLNTVASLLENTEEVGNAIDQIIALVEGLNQLATGYAQFHEGLVAFADGLNQLDSNYAELNGGVADLADGASQLGEGADELAAGVSELNGATINLPETMRAEIEKMMADYEFPEFVPVSFVDERNESMAAVQFVMTTAAITIPEPEAAEEVVEEEETMVDRFVALFE